MIQCLLLCSALTPFYDELKHQLRFEYMLLTCKSSHTFGILE